MSPTRVLVVEDSPTVRERIRAVLDADPGLDVVAEAADGNHAVRLCEQTRPDVITMDMVLPDMNGLAAIELIMANRPTPILVVSSSTNRGELLHTYDALAAGAVDVLAKPRGDASDQEWARQLISKVKMAARIRVITHPRVHLARSACPTSPDGVRPAPRRPSMVPSRMRAACEVVAIGASTGGPAAVVELLRTLPASFPIPILLVLHMVEPFGVGLADWLAHQTGRPVAHPRDGAPLHEVRGKVAMAPPGQHLRVAHGRLVLGRDEERNFCRPSVDVLFESLAAEHGPTATGCLLTGMGRDGARGLLALRQRGAVTIAQDEATSVVYGMPREAARLGAADLVLPLPEIGPALVELAAADRGRRA
jgi:two-component system, chemotaxis family, protein-glutamate methylesterase/glutaminase